MGEFDWTSFIENLWDRENAQGKKGIEGKGGFRGGKYYPYTTPNGNFASALGTLPFIMTNNNE